MNNAPPCSWTSGNASDWNVYGVCPCGYRRLAPFKSLFHIHVVVCPECGRDKSEWRVRVSRWVDTGKWWRREGYWEDKGAPAARREGER